MKYAVHTENGKQVLTPVEGGQLAPINGSPPAARTPVMDGQFIEIVQHAAAEGNRLFAHAAEVAKANIPTHVIDEIEIINEE